MIRISETHISDILSLNILMIMLLSGKTWLWFDTAHIMFSAVHSYHVTSSTARQICFYLVSSMCSNHMNWLIQLSPNFGHKTRGKSNGSFNKIIFIKNDRSESLVLLLFLPDLGFSSIFAIVVSLYSKKKIIHTNRICT